MYLREKVFGLTDRLYQVSALQVSLSLNIRDDLVVALLALLCRNRFLGIPRQKQNHIEREMLASGLSINHTGLLETEASNCIRTASEDTDKEQFDPKDNDCLRNSPRVHQTRLVVTYTSLFLTMISGTVGEPLRSSSVYYCWLGSLDSSGWRSELAAIFWAVKRLSLRDSAWAICVLCLCGINQDNDQIASQILQTRRSPHLL